ncbi:MAG: TetR family transcriptional regulator [Solirubrobacterales bacterium]
MSRTGRRPGETASRQAILDVATRQFGDRGYDAATIRSIAADAGVDPALVMHFFGSKTELFMAAVHWPFDPAEEIPKLTREPVEEAGRRLVELVVSTWDAEDKRNPIVALLRAAMNQEAAARQLHDFLELEIHAPLMAALGSDRIELRANLVTSQLLGLGVVRYVLAFQPIADLEAAAVVDLVAPSVQASLTGEL